MPGGARAAWALGRAGSLAPCHPLNYGSRTPAPLAGTVPPGPTATPARGLSAWERPPGSRAGLGGCHCRPGAPRGWRSCGRALARCPSTDGNRARCYRQQRGRRRRGWRMPGAGGAAGAGVSSPSPPSRAAVFLLLPQLCQPRAGDGRGFSTAACRLLPSASVSLEAGLGGNCPHVPWSQSPSISSGVTALLRLAMTTAWTRRAQSEQPGQDGRPLETGGGQCAVGQIPLQGLGRARLWEGVI